MAVFEAGVYALVTLLMGSIVGIGDGELLEDPELRLDQVEPGRLRGCEDGMNVELFEHPEKPRMIVDQMQVVENDKESAVGIASP